MGVLVVSLISGRLGSRHIRARAIVSAAFLTAGMLWVHLIIAGLADHIDHWWFLPPLLISGLGLGLGFSALFQAVLSNVPARDAGAGSGALQAFQQVGGALGVALVGQIFFSTLEGAGGWGAASPQAAFAGAASLATWCQVASFGAVLLLVVLLLRVKDPDRQSDGSRRAAAAVVSQIASRSSETIYARSAMPAPCSVKSSTSTTCGVLPLRMTTPSTPFSSASRQVSTLGIMPPEMVPSAMSARASFMVSSGMSFLSASSTPSTSVRKQQALGAQRAGNGASGTR